MESLKNILWPIVLVGGLGAFIDFLIGKAGQERAKNFLLKWWVRFDDIRWRSFGREEGLFAGELIGRWCGQRIWSLRRFVAAVTTLFLLLCIGYLRFVVSSSQQDYLCGHCNSDDNIIAVIVFFISFSLSISLTKFVAFRMAYLCGDGTVRNLLIFTLMLIVNYLILMMISPITEYLKYSIIAAFPFDSILLALEIFSSIPSYLLLGMTEGIRNSFHPTELFEITYSIDLFAFYFLSLSPSLFRFALSIIFVGSFLLRPLVMRPISLVWARIIESEKPVFTVLFGGAAAFASAISEAAKHL